MPARKLRFLAFTAVAILIALVAFSNLPDLLAFVIGVPGFLVALRELKSASGSRSHGSGELDPKDPDALRELPLEGRGPLLKRLEEKLGACDTLWLSGIQGTGKTSLVDEQGLLGRLLKAGRPAILLRTWFPAEDSALQLAEIFQKKLRELDHPELRGLPDDLPKQIEDLPTFLQALSSPLTLIIDQFDEYAAAFPQDIALESSVLSKARLLEQNAFWRAIAKCIEDRNLRCVFVDTGHPHRAFEFGRSVELMVPRLPKGTPLAVLNTLGPRIVGNHENREFKQLVRKISSELERGPHGRALAIDMATVIAGLSYLKRLSIEEYLKVRGGTEELKVRFFRSELHQAVERLDLDYSDLLAVFSRMLASTERFCSVRELASDIPSQKHASVEEALDYLRGRSVRLVLRADRAGSSVWRLYHDLWIPLMRKLIDRDGLIQDRYRAYLDSGGLIGGAKYLLIGREFVLVLALLGQAGRLSNVKKYGVFIGLSFLTLPLRIAWWWRVIVVAALVVGANYWIDKRVSGFAGRFDSREAISAEERDALWALDGEWPYVRFKLLSHLLDSNAGAEKFSAHSDYLLAGRWGEKELSKKIWYVKRLFSRYCAEVRTASSMGACDRLAFYLPTVPADYAALALERSSTHRRDGGYYKMLAFPQDVDRDFELVFMLLLRETVRSGDLGALEAASEMASGRLDPQDLCFVARTRLAEALKRGVGWSSPVAWLEAISSFASCAEPQELLDDPEMTNRMIEALEWHYEPELAEVLASLDRGYAPGVVARFRRSLEQDLLAHEPGDLTLYWFANALDILGPKAELVEAAVAEVPTLLRQTSDFSSSSLLKAFVTVSDFTPDRLVRTVWTNIARTGTLHSDSALQALGLLYSRLGATERELALQSHSLNPALLVGSVMAVEPGRAGELAQDLLQSEEFESDAVAAAVLLAPSLDEEKRLELGAKAFQSGFKSTQIQGGEDEARERLAGSRRLGFRLTDDEEEYALQWIEEGSRGACYLGFVMNEGSARSLLTTLLDWPVCSLTERRVIAAEVFGADLDNLKTSLALEDWLLDRLRREGLE